jgi:O-antigen/teichoic acid export membrane protein
MTLKKQALSGVKWTSLIVVVRTVVNFLQVAILAHFLSPADFGLMGMVMIVVGFGETYADLGISAAIIYKQNASREQLSSLYWLNVLSSFVVFLVCWIIAPIITVFFHEPRLSMLIKTVLICFLINPFGKQFEILLQKNLSFGILAKLEITACVTSFFAALAAVYFGLGVWTLVIAFFVNIFVKTILLVLAGLSEFRPSLHFRLNDIRGFISFGLFQMGERTVNYLSERLDQILIGRFLGVNMLGYYSFAFNLVVQPISRINPIITRVAFPVFAKIQNDNTKLRNGYLKVLTTVNAPLLCGLIASAPVAIPLIFGAKWNESILLIQILGFVTLLRSVGNPVGSLQLARGRADLGFKWNVLFLALSAPAILLGAKLGQGVGIAIALLILQIMLMIPGYLFLLVPLIGSCARAYFLSFSKPISLALVMGVFVAAMLHLLGFLHQDFLRLLTTTILGIISYVCLLWFFDKNELPELRALIFTKTL